MSDLDKLEAYIDEGIKRSYEAHLPPTRIKEMRDRFGTIGAIERLVSSGDIQSGFQAAVAAGLAEWTLEAAVLKFPSLFSKQLCEAAEFRLKQAGAV